MKGYKRARDRRSAETKKSRRLPADQQTWLLVVEGGYVEGKRTQRFRSFVGTEREADAALRKFIAEVERGEVYDEKLTVEAYATKWLEQKRNEGLASRTISRYESAVRLHVVPALGALPLAKVKPLHVRQAMATWRAGRKDRKKGDLSARTLHHVFMLLSSIFADAQRDDLTRKNPCRQMRAPSKGRSAVTTVDEETTLAILDRLDDTPLGVAARLALFTGVRRGELLALTWADVDLDGRALSIGKSLEMTRENGVTGARVKSPKTASSVRTVPLPLTAVALLKAHRVAHAQALLASGLSASPADLVFPNPDPYRFDPRAPWLPDRFSASYYQAVRASKLGDVSFHALCRHGYASLSLRAGTPLKVVSTILGHASLAVTGDLYTHVLAGLEREAADRVGDLLERAEARRAAKESAS